MLFCQISPDTPSTTPLTHPPSPFHVRQKLLQRPLVLLPTLLVDSRRKAFRPAIIRVWNPSTTASL